MSNDHKLVGNAAENFDRFVTGTTTGLDPDRTMLEVARALSANDDLPIEWCEAFVDDMPFDDLRFDAVISTQTIMFFPDLDKGIKEICGVMAPKAVPARYEASS